MKKTICILSIMMLVSVSFGHLWTNASGDQDFTRGSNWFDLDDTYNFTSSDRATVNLGGANAAILSTDSARENLFMGNSAGANAEVFITGGTNTFASGNFAMNSGTTALVDISGGDTTFSGYFTVGSSGTASFVLSDGVVTVNRSNIGQVAGSVGEYIISGGEMNIATFVNVGLNGEGNLTMTGGTLNVGSTPRLGRGSIESIGIIDISGDAVFNALGSFTYVGEVGYGAVYVDGGEFNIDRISFGTEADPNSRGYMFVTNGVVNSSLFFTIGNSGTAGVEVSGTGVINSNRMLLGQNVSAGDYYSNGYLTISGGAVNIEDQFEVGRDGIGTFTLDGSSGVLNCAQFVMGGLGVSNFILDGSAGVGKGIGAFAGGGSVGRVLLKEGASVDASFANGTDVAGDYIVIAGSELITFLPETEPDTSLAVVLPFGDATDFLTTDSQTAGWTASIIPAGTGSAFVVTSPVATNKTAWAGAGAGDIAVVDDDSVALSSAKASVGAVIGEAQDGVLDVSAGADGQFANLTVAEDAESTGTINITGGSVSAESVAYIGKEGSADVNISGGSLSALNLLAATGEDASADIKVSGNGSLAVNNLLGLSSGSSLTVSGFQTNVEAANITLAEGASLNFELNQDHGAGNGIVVSNNVILDGIINLSVIGGRIDNTYTLIRAEGEIIVNNTNLLTSSFVTYEVVENEEYQELQVTFFTPEDCEQVIDTGFGLIGDLNEDCYIDLADFAIIASNWLVCNNPTDPACELVFD